MGDFAFVQHMLATLNHNGVCGVVMPHGVLFRGSGDGKIRKSLLEDDLIEAIIGLPENLFAGTGIPAIILIINRNKKPEHKGKILFIHASKEVDDSAKKSVLGKANIRRIVETFRNWRPEERFSRIVEMPEVIENEYNLNISRYIDTLEPEAEIDVTAELDKLQIAEDARNAAEARMNALLKEMGYVG